jgi:hypothetical protein
VSCHLPAKGRSLPSYSLAWHPHFSCLWPPHTPHLGTAATLASHCPIGTSFLFRAAVFLSPAPPPLPNSLRTAPCPSPGKPS